VLGASYEAQQGVEAGGWFSDAAQAPRVKVSSESRRVKAIKTGKNSGALDRSLRAGPRTSHEV